jgi:hypothetical protein
MNTKRSSVRRILGMAAITAFLIIGAAPIVALAWKLVPNHGLAALAIVVLVPFFVWGFFSDGDF